MASYVTDDANNCGLTTACSKLISVSSNPALFTTGILKTGTEDDYYRFVSPRTGMMVFTASPKNISTSSVSGSQHGQDHTGANLDILMKLYNSSGATLAGSAENDDRLDAIFSNSVTSGQSYYIKIENDGLSSYRDFGYKNNDDFAIIGNYALRAFYPGVLASGISVLCPNVSIGFSTLASSASTYQWYYKAGTAAAPAVLTSTAGWLPVSGATSSSLVPATGVGVRTYACRVTYQGVSAWASGVRTITSIVPSVAQGAIASGNQTFNGSGDPNPINFSSAPSGGSGGFSYRWYFRPGIHPAPTGTTIPAGWSLIPTATTNTYDPPVVYSSVSYAVMVDPTGSPDCGVSAWAAGVRQITVNNGCITSYCISPGFIYNEGLYINSFRLGGTAITTGFNAGYASIGLGTQLLRSQSVAFNIAAGNNSAIGYLNIYYKLFADWNRDGDFTDLGEEVYASSAISGLGEVTGSFIVPSTASLGRTTIRVQLVDFRGANPCWDHFELESGEVEDYCVEILNNSFNPGVIDFANQTLCFGGDPNNIIFSTPPFPSAGSSFQWYYKDGLIAAPDGIASTAGWTLITGATSSSYDPPAALSVSRTYACRVINGPDNQWASGVRQITVFPLVISGVIEANNENFIGSGDPAVINLINAPRGGAGTFTYQWYSSPGIKSAPTGTVIPTGWTAIPGATSNSYNPPVQSASISFAVQVNPTGTPDCGDATWAASERQITVTSTSFTPGVIAAGNQTLCNPADPGSITFSAAATIGSTLQWYFQNGIIAAPAATATTTGWTLISGAGAASYDPPSGLTTSRTYACRVINGTNNQWASGVRQNTVLPALNLGALVAGNQTFTGSGDPSVINFATAPSGGAGTFTFQWYSSPGIQIAPAGSAIPSGWTVISGATSNSYDPPVQSASISFAVQVNPTGTPDCGSATWAAGVRQITVTSTSFTPGVIAAGNQTLCNPGDPGNITFSAAATSGATLQWYFQNGIIAAPAATATTTGWTLISGAGASSYDPPSGLTASRTYACRVINGTNNQWASGVRQITVLPVFSPGSLIANQTGCNAYDPASITMVTNPQGSGAYNWRWYYQENATVTCPPGTNPPPSGWVTSTTDTRFFGTSTTGTGIFFDPSSPGATGRTWTLLITPAANGSIPACGTAQYATTCHRTIRQACRMEEDVTMLGDAYPNPADDMMQIPYFIADGQSKGSIKIFNSAGQLMHTFTCLSGKELVQQFSVSDLPSGVYYYSLEVNQTKISTRKLIVFH
jgi:hypothetical protein